MAPQCTRRQVLQTAPAVTVIGVAGCAGSESERGFGIEIRNELTETDFETTDQIEEPAPVTVHVRVENVDSDQERANFERTTEVPPETTRTFENAFMVLEDSSLYSMGVEMEPLVEGGLSSNRTRRDSHSFTPENRPERNPIPIIIHNQYRQAEEKGLAPNIYISPG